MYKVVKRFIDKGNALKPAEVGTSYPPKNVKLSTVRLNTLLKGGFIEEVEAAKEAAPKEEKKAPKKAPKKEAKK